MWRNWFIYDHELLAVRWQQDGIRQDTTTKVQIYGNGEGWQWCSSSMEPALVRGDECRQTLSAGDMIARCLEDEVKIADMRDWALISSVGLQVVGSGGGADVTWPAYRNWDLTSTLWVSKSCLSHSILTQNKYPCLCYSKSLLAHDPTSLLDVTVITISIRWPCGFSYIVGGRICALSSVRTERVLNRSH